MHLIIYRIKILQVLLLEYGLEMLMRKELVSIIGEGLLFIENHYQLADQWLKSIQVMLVAEFIMIESYHMIPIGTIIANNTP